MAYRLDSLRIASPCHERWDRMIGDERVRLCKACDRQVFDLSRLTRDEAEALLDASGVKPCVRFRRRADGTVVTADCAPRGHPMIAGAVAAAAVLATAAPAIAEPSAAAPDAQVTGALEGVVRDAGSGELLIGATVVVTDAVPSERAEVTDEQGRYAFPALPPGTYTVTIYYDERTHERGNVVVTAGKVSFVNVSMSLEASAVIVLDGDYLTGIPESRTFGAALGVVAAAGDPLGVTFAPPPAPPPPPPRPRLELSSWVRAGYGTAIWEAALGVDLSVRLRESLRVGAWTEARTSSGPVLGVELLLEDGEVLALRAGGNGDAVTAAIAYGHRAPWSGQSRYMTGVRLVVSATRALDDPRDWSATAGLEVDPLGALRALLP